jgi:inner membrane protein
MTGRTHDLTAFTALNIAFLIEQPLPHMTFGTVAAAIGANMIGGLMPDIDNATSDIWDKFRGGNIIAKLIKPLIGQHRMLSHSLVGMIIAGFLCNLFLIWLKKYVLVDMNIVWWSIMIGYFSHLVSDSMTKQGVPWFFPIPLRFGFPPFKFLRIETGGFVEKSFVFPGLLILNGYLLYSSYDSYINFAKSFLN